MKYQSELINEILEDRGHKKSSLHYESECVEPWIEETKGAYPKLCDYEGEWLNYMVENPIGSFPYETITANPTATVSNVVPYAYRSAILTGNTKYHDIDTGEFLETFEEGRNLELVSVKMPVLTTSNEDGTKTNILTVNEPVELHGIGDVQETLDLLTGEVNSNFKKTTLNSNVELYHFNYNEQENTVLSRIRVDGSKNNGKIICDKLKTTSLWGSDVEGIEILNDAIQIRLLKSRLSDISEQSFKEVIGTLNPIIIYETEKSVKTVELTVTNQNGETLSKIKPIEGTMNIESSGTPIHPTAVLEVPVESITQNLNSFIAEE